MLIQSNYVLAVSVAINNQTRAWEPINLFHVKQRMYDIHYVKKSEKHQQRQVKLCLHGFFKKICNLQIHLVSWWSFFHPIHGVERAKVTTIYLDTRVQWLTTFTSIWTVRNFAPGVITGNTLYIYGWLTGIVGSVLTTNWR